MMKRIWTADNLFNSSTIKLWAWGRVPIGIVEPMRKLIRLCGVSMTTLWVVNTRHHHTEKTVLVNNTYLILRMKGAEEVYGSMDLVNIIARTLDSEWNLWFLWSQRMTVLSRFWAQILNFGCKEVQIVNLNIPSEISFCLFYVPDVTRWRKWLEIVTHLSVLCPWWWIQI